MTELAVSPLHLLCISQHLPYISPVSPVQASVTELAPGGVLFRQGDRSSAFYLVDSGEIEMSLVPDDAEEGDAAIPVRR